MSSEKFEELDDEVDLLLDELQRTLKNRLPKFGGEQLKAEIRKVEHKIEDVEHLIQNMALEADMAPVSYRSSMVSKVRDHKAKLEKLYKEMKKCKGSAGGRGELLGGPSIDDPLVAQRNRMMDGLESLERASASVDRSRQVAHETTEIGAGIITDLGEQKESLIRTRDRLSDADGNLSKSRRILTTMSVSVATNKMVLVMVIIVELAILGAVVYLRFFKNR